MEMKRIGLHRLIKSLGVQGFAIGGTALLVMMVSIRLVPYVVPIEAEDLEQVDQAIAFRDRHNRPLGTLLSRDQEHTAVVPLEQVSPHFIQAILAAEDQRFYDHGPVDWHAVARASWQGIRDRRIVSGASTVTMQLARMLDPVPRTFSGKAQQVWQAWRLAAGMNKDEMLAAYVNRLPMGSNIYGVEAAARVYFEIPAMDLTVAQASLLAALPNAPTALNPYTGWDALKERQRYVLDRMVAAGHLSEGQSDRAFAEAVTFQLPEQQFLAAPHFQFWLAATLPQDHPAQVKTTLDLNLQRFVEAQVQQMVRGLAAKQVRQGAALVVENATGEVLAYVGSPSYFSVPRSWGISPHRAAGENDGVQALRQPGSTLKPFLYQLALEQSVIKPNSILQDVPTHYAIPGAQLYSPVDYSETFQGPVRVRAALGNSLNIPAVRVLEDVGVDVFLERLRQLGFEHLDQSAEHYGLGLSLGSGEVSLWELTQAYLTLARGAQSDIKLTGVLSPTLNIGTSRARPMSIDSGQHHSIRHTSPAVESLITDILSDPHARATAFGVESVLNLPFPAAVKTGTSSDFRDTWTVGFTQDYTVATWVGNFDGAPMHQVSGVTGAAPLWHRIMVHLHKEQEPGQFASPAGMVQRPICATTGQKPLPDCDAVVQEYFFSGDVAAYEGEGSGSNAIASIPDIHATDPPNLSVTTNVKATDVETTDAKTTEIKTTELRISSPPPNSRFLVFPTANPGNDQHLEFAIRPGPAAVPDASSPLQWFLNGQALESAGQASVFWPMRPGQWTLEARRGKQTAQVEFEVEWAEPQASRKGFSVKNYAESP